jgi:hypothetical protein
MNFMVYIFSTQNINEKELLQDRKLVNTGVMIRIHLACT